MLPFPQVVCPMEEDASTPLHCETQPHTQSSSFVKSSHNSEDGEKKKSIRRSGRLRTVKEQEQERKESRKPTQRRGRLASSQTAQKIAGGIKRCSRRNVQSGIIMHKRGRNSTRTVNKVTGIPNAEDHVARKSNADLEASQPEKDVHISEPPESPSPAKQWVIGPLLQSFKTKMACFTEIVMSPMRLFRPNNSLPTSPDGTKLRLDSVQEGYVNSDATNGCLSEMKKEIDHTEKVEDGRTGFTSQEDNALSQVIMESDTDAVDFSHHMLNQGTGTNIDGQRKYFWKPSSVQILKLDTDTEVQLHSKEQGSIILEQNMGLVASTKAYGQQDCQTDGQVCRSDKKQEAESHFCLEHSSILSTSFHLDSVPCDSVSVSSPQDSHTDGQQSLLPFSSDTKQQSELHVLMHRLGSKRASPCLDVPPDCPKKRSVMHVSENHSTTQSKNAQVLSEEKTDFCNVKEQGYISKFPTLETNATVGSDSSTSLLYCTPPNTLITSVETETNLCQQKILEKDVNVCPSISPILCNVGEEDTKGCTKSEFSPSTSSVTAANVYEEVSVLTDHGEIFEKKGECGQNEPQRGDWPEPCLLQKEHANAPHEEENEKKVTEKTPGVHAEEEDKKLRGAGKRLRGGIVLNKRGQNIAEEILITPNQETKRCKRPYQVRRGRGPNKCKNNKEHDVRTSQDTDNALPLLNSSSGDKNGGSNKMLDLGSHENTKSSNESLRNNNESHVLNRTNCAFLPKVEPVVVITKLSPDYTVPAIISTAKVMCKDEVGTITSGTLNAEVGHQVPRKESQRCRRQKKNVSRDPETDSSTNFNNELIVQHKVESSPETCSSLQKVTKESKGECSRVSLARKCQWQGMERPKKRTRNWSSATKSKHIGQQKEEEKWQTEKFSLVKLTREEAQLEGPKKIYNETSGQVELERDNKSLHQKWKAHTRNFGKSFLHHDDKQKLSDLETAKMPTMDFTNPVDFDSGQTLNSPLPSVTIGSPGFVKSVDGSAYCEKTFEQSDSKTNTVPSQMLDHERHPVCTAEHSAKVYLLEKPDQEAETSVFFSSPASAATQKFGGRKVADTEVREEAESWKICMPAGSDLLTEQRGCKAKHRKMPSKSHFHRRRARSWLRNEGWGKDNINETEVHKKDATTQKTSGNSPFPTCLLRSYSCPEISSLSENSAPLLPSNLHCKLPSSLHQCPQVHTPNSAARRARRHTVCSLEVEREIAPLCLRKEVYPTGWRRLCCSPASICSTSPSYNSLTALASLFLSSPLAFLSQNSTGASGGSSIHFDFAPSSCGVATSSSTSPGSSSVHNLFTGSSGCISPRSGQCSTSVSSVCSKSTVVPLEHEGGTRHRQQQEESRSFHLEFAARESREEKSLSDSEIKMENTKQEYGKVSRIRIRKTLPKPLNNLTPMGLPKPVRLKKKEFSLEEIYTNKNFRKPPEGRLETIFEVPVSGRDGSLSLVSQRRFKRLVEFPEAGVARKPKRPLVGSGVCRKTRETSSVGRTRRGGNAQAKEGCCLTPQELDSLLCSKLNQLDSWISLDQVGVLV